MTKDSPQPNDRPRTGREPTDGDAARAQDGEAPPTPYADTSRLRAAWRMGINPNTTEAESERFQRQWLSGRGGLDPDPEPQA